MPQPDFKVLTIYGTGTASTRTKLNTVNLPWPFKPLAFAHKSTGRYKAELYLNDEQLQNAGGDGDAMFGTQGELVRIPAAAQKIIPEKRDFTLYVTDLAGASNIVSLAIFGLQYTGLKISDLPPQPRHWIKWLNLYKPVGASSSAVVSDTLSFPFIPTHIGFKATGRATIELKADRIPFQNQAADIDAVLGTSGRLIAIPPEARKKYPAKTVFSAELTDLSGSTNVVTVTLFGIQTER